MLKAASSFEADSESVPVLEYSFGSTDIFLRSFMLSFWVSGWGSWPGKERNGVVERGRLWMRDGEGRRRRVVSFERGRVEGILIVVLVLLLMLVLDWRVRVSIGRAEG